MSRPDVPTSSELRDWIERSFWLMAHGQLSDFDQFVHPDATNREAHAEPPAARQAGPDGYYATAAWLRGTYADLAFEVHDVVADGDLIAVHATMSGRHVAEAVFYRADGSVDQVFPATGRPSRSLTATGTACATVWCSSTGPTATTSPWRRSSAGCHRPRCTSCG